jgi:hypothetical protein
MPNTGMTMKLNRYAATWVWVMLLVAATAQGKTLNGNDFALYFSEATTEDAQRTLLAEAKGNLHYFRYLHIRTLQEGTRSGRPYAEIEAVEPASLLKVRFTVTKPESLQTLKQDPESGPGDAIAVTGRLVGVDPKDKVIKLDPVIVRHKDRLDPKVGKELLAEVKPNSVYYSYAGGNETIQVPYKDRDLLLRKKEILGQQGPQAWTDYLKQELAKRRTP